MSELSPVFCYGMLSELSPVLCSVESQIKLSKMSDEDL